MVEAEEEIRSLQQDTTHHAADDILPADPASSSSSNGQSLTFVSTKSGRQYSTDFWQKLQQWMSTYRERGARTKRKVQSVSSQSAPILERERTYDCSSTLLRHWSRVMYRLATLVADVAALSAQLSLRNFNENAFMLHVTTHVSAIGSDDPAAPS